MATEPVPIKVIIERAGGAVPLARELGLHRTAPSKWERLPPEHVHVVCRLTGLQPHEVRPDLWHAPSDRGDVGVTLMGARPTAQDAA